MDIISFNEAATANGRIESFIENPDSTSGIVTVPKVITSGENITIPAGRIAVLPNVQVDGTLNIDGEVFIPSGATFGDLESQIAVKADTNYVDNKYSGFKNFIINGDMRIAQRGDGPFTATGYGIDQWFSYISSTSGVNRIWNGTGSNHISYAQVNVGSGADTVTMEQRLESPHRFSGKTLTLSYTLFNGTYSGSNVDYGISLNHAGGRTILFSGTSVFTGGTKKKVTFTVPDLSGYTLNASSYLEIKPVEIIQRGYSGVFGITDIQLEEGSVATPFEQRPYGLELSLCQRYYSSLSTYLHPDTQWIRGSIYNTCNFRTTPTVTLTYQTPSTGALSFATGYATNEIRFYNDGNMNNTGGDFSLILNASAEL